MSVGSQVISRRKLFLLMGLAAGVAVPTAALVASSAEAQQPTAETPPSGQTEKKKKKKKKAAPMGAAPSQPNPQ